MGLFDRSRRKLIERVGGRRRRLLLIRLDTVGAGIFAHFCVNIGWMKWAREHGFVPYVDMKDCRNLFTQGGLVPFNPWEFFFSQCRGVGLSSIVAAQSAFVTRPRIVPEDWPDVTPYWLQEGHDKLVYWRKFVQDEIMVASDIATRVERLWRERLGGDGNILGCLVRGTDYRTKRPSGHPIQPDPDVVVQDAQEICQRFGLSRVFLATEDVEIREHFREAFGSGLIMAQDDLPTYEGGLLTDAGSMSDAMRALEISRQYVASILLLSRCNYLLAGCTSGTVGACLFSSGFKWSRVYDLGFYP